jgi:hypothetical protein
MSQGPRSLEELMGSLAVLLLATPIFGFSLQAPALTSTMFELSAQTAAAVQAVQAAEAAPLSPQKQYVQEIKRRNSIAAIHRTFGIATWIAMTATVVVGALDYYNLYGIGANQGQNPCVKGTAIGGEGGCSALRPIKSVAAYATTALYATTFTLSLMMPDPDNLSVGKGEFASTLRLHKTLRWVHFGGMVAQILLGPIIAHSLAGQDRANHYGTLQALATVHMGLGLVTWGALTWAGALMVF